MHDSGYTALYNRKTMASKKISGYQGLGWVAVVERVTRQRIKFIQQKILCDTIIIHIYHHPWSKSLKCTTSRMTPKIHHRLWVTVEKQCRFISL